MGLHDAPLIKFTELGGLAVKLYNRTGSATVAGQVVEADSGTDDGVVLVDVDGDHPIGVFLEDGVADDELAWVVIAGIADVYLTENTGSTAGNWVQVSSESGYADATTAVPPGGAVAQLDIHMTEIGHCLETVAAAGAGTWVKARCLLHFN